MNAAVEYLLNTASAEQITEHLVRCDASFVPILSGRVDVGAYAGKIAVNAMRFEAWSGSTLVGLVAAYCNDKEKRVAYVTTVSVLAEWTGQGIAVRLMEQCTVHAKALGMKQIDLEVAESNTPAVRLYEKCGFTIGGVNATFVEMNLSLEDHGT